MMLDLKHSLNRSTCSRPCWWLGLFGLAGLLATRAAAQSVTNLHSFNTEDGAYPQASLIVSSSTLYGTTEDGGSGAAGTVFRVNTDGTGFTNLHNFTEANNNNTDGASPKAGLVLSGNSLFGTAVFGGSGGAGTVFKISTDGMEFTNVYTFGALSESDPRTNSDGAHPTANLVLSNNTLYGTAEDGGSGGSGAVFKINTDGTEFTNLHSFTEVTTNNVNSTNTDGANPRAGLVLSGNSLYGTTYRGGFFGAGTVFKLNADGTGFTNLYNFTGSNDGGNPQSGLILSGNSLYGTASTGGGTANNGTVFQVNTDGMGFTNLYNFTNSSYGDDPRAALILSGDTLYGTTYGGGSSDHGTIFTIKTNGTALKVLYSFTTGIGSLLNPTNSDGAFPGAGLILSSNILYGTAIRGGSGGVGTVFALTVARPAPVFQAVTVTNKTLNLTWTTVAGGMYQLQYNSNANSGSWSNLLGSALTAAGATLSATDSVTNGPRRFYRAVLLP